MGDCWGLGIWHVHIGCDPTGHGGPGFGIDVALVCQPRLPEVDLIVDHAGQNGIAPGVQLPVCPLT